MRPSISCNNRTIQMASSAARQEHHQTRDILRTPESLIRRVFLQLLQTPLQSDEAVGHLGRVEPRGDRIAQNMAGTQLDSQVLGQMDDGGLARRVREDRVVPQTT